MGVELDEDRRSGLIEGLRGIYLEEFDQELSAFRAERLVEFFLASAGPEIYNQAVQDARKFMLTKLDDLDAEVYVSPPAPDG